MTFHRKIGGIHWFALGPVRVSVCLVRSVPNAQAKPRTINAKLKVLRQAIGVVPEGLASQGGNSLASEATEPPSRIYQGPKLTIEDWRRINQSPMPKTALPRTTLFPWPPETKQ